MATDSEDLIVNNINNNSNKILTNGNNKLENTSQHQHHHHHHLHQAQLHTNGGGIYGTKSPPSSSNAAIANVIENGLRNPNDNHDTISNLEGGNSSGNNDRNERSITGISINRRGK